MFDHLQLVDVAWICAVAYGISQGIGACIDSINERRARNANPE